MTDPPDRSMVPAIARPMRPRSATGADVIRNHALDRGPWGALHPPTCMVDAEDPRSRQRGDGGTAGRGQPVDVAGQGGA